MKILTGRFKDTAIMFKPQPGLRPTPDRVRKAIVDALSPGWEGAEVLDLFAGTGALGLEALSAGAAAVVWVEADRRRAEEIERTVRGLKGVGKESQVERGEAFVVLAKLAERGAAFDRVLADPPYEKGLALKTLEFFSHRTALKPGAWVALETYKKEALPDRLGCLERRKTAQYGDTAVHYYILV